MAFDRTASEVKGIYARFHLPFEYGKRNSANKGFTLEVDLNLPGKGITGIFGPSGSGKTTLLRCIAGLQPVPGGHLKVNGTTWQAPGKSLATYKRPLGFVFQQPSLFPHLTARENLEFARKRAPVTISPSEIDPILSLMGIEPLMERMPAQLSGGEQQRIAIARALLIKPELLMMDEPLASLDIGRKQEILPYLEALHRELDIPVLYVSHSVDEIARLADHLLIMEQGRVRRAGPAPALMSQTDFPAPIGDDIGVLISARIIKRDSQWQLACAHFDGGEIWLRDSGEPLHSEIRLRVLARDVSLSLSPVADTSILNRIPAVITEILADRDPAMVLVKLHAESADGISADRPQAPGATESAVQPAASIIARITRRSLQHLELTPGKRVWAQIKSVAIVR